MTDWQSILMGLAILLAITALLDTLDAEEMGDAED